MSSGKKCVSYCKNLSKYDCATRRKCIRTKDTSKTRSHCRLSRKYTMKKSDNCKLFRKYTKKDAAHTITKFFKKTSNRRRALFLKSICSDSGVCIAFGKEINKIKDFFNGFTNFEYLTNVKTIGNPSSNGFVKLLTYNNDGYIGNAVLKSSLSSRSDNLYYEYLVGLFLNKQSYWLPSFVETYGLYEYRSNEIQKEIKISNSITKIKNSNYLINISNTHTMYKFRTSCDTPSQLAILIQSFVGAKTLGSALKETLGQDPDFIIIDLIPILFQVYMSLFLLKSVFTHYDLHTQNVLLYEPVSNGYIKYIYHLDNGSTVRFNSRYIVKIIDYGRCFFNDTTSSADTSKSISIHKELCKMPICKPDCGSNKGYPFLNITPNKINGYISSINNNQSHDLRLLNEIRLLHKVKHLISIYTPTVWNMLQDVVYEHRYGTPENLDPPSNTSINNISNTVERLLDLISEPDFIILNAKYENHEHNYKLLGELHIYSNKTPMKFIPSS